MKKFIHQQRLSIGKIKLIKNTWISIDIIRCGPLIDLCRGPHIRHTGKVKAFALTKVRERNFFFNWWLMELYRIHPPIGKVIKVGKHYSVFMEFHFLIQNNWKNGNFFKKKQQNEIIERLVLNKISSSFMNLVLDHVSFIQKEHIFIINWSNLFEFVEEHFFNFLIFRFSIGWIS
jgi:hypothetical protein